jgi:phenylalanyl-tRNA synthetase beta chain
MKISLDWLGDFVAWKNPDPDTVADRLTLSTAEIEDVAVQGALLAHCCVGEILSVNPHPNADKLRLVMVKTDKGEKKVVCGGTNLKVGQKVAFAHIGATVKWHGGELMTLAPVKIRGEESHGMICAAEELGIETQYPAKPEDGERPIVDLGDMKAGQPLKEALGVSDAIFDVNNTAITTRPDLWSHRGMARECIALGLGKAKPEPKRPALKFPKDALPFTFSAPAKKNIVRYLGCAIDMDPSASSGQAGESPSWMKTRLEAVGIRPISLAVDITNYVMLEWGSPLHAFDVDDIQGKVELRAAKAGEKIVTLDGVERSLPEGALVLSDDAGIFDLVSMMGGKRTSITEKTRRIYLQAPAPDAILIRKTIQATGHRTDAATIFEKSVPPVHMEAGFRRAVELFLELAPGAKISSKLEEWGDDGKAPTIKLPLERVASILGIELKTKDVVSILESLGCMVKMPAKGAAEILTVTPPLHRLRDLQGPHDLVEEVARIHGFENIENVRPRGTLRPIPRETIEQRVSTILAAEGFKQILPLSLVGPKLLRQAGIDPETATAIGNPLTEELSLLQPSTIPQLLDHARRSHLLAEGDLRTFHCAHVFPRGEAERSECGLLHLGTHDGLLHDPFLSLIERVAHALKVLGHASTIEKDATPASSAHPGRSAVLKIGTVAVARVFDVKPSSLAAFDLPHRASCATLDLTALGALMGAVIKAVPLPAHPAVTYDLTFKRTHNDAIGPLLAKLRGASTLLESVDVKDLYDGKGVEPGSYNATLRFTYRAPDRTLTEQEAKAEHDRILQGNSLAT